VTCKHVTPKLALQPTSRSFSAVGSVACS
jgi:hypothetical protein